jgi:uncharacterized protein YidB (DUF937 family)
MGLFDSIAGQVVGALSQGGNGNTNHAGLMDVVSSLINSPQTGGLQGLINQFQQGGLGSVVASWVGTGQNLPISGEQLQALLGNEQIQAMAQKLGISTQDVSAHLAQLLPQVVDHLTPTGEVPAGGLAQGGLEDTLGGLLKGFLK